MKSETSEVLNIERCRKAVEDLREPRPGVYFADAGISAFVGWCCFGISLLGVHPGLRVAAFIVSALLLYRVLAFIHEVFHQQALKAFRFFWHVVAGIPLLLPFLLYLPIHQVHHNARNRCV